MSKFGIFGICTLAMLLAIGCGKGGVLSSLTGGEGGVFGLSKGSKDETSSRDSQDAQLDSSTDPEALTLAKGYFCPYEVNMGQGRVKLQDLKRYNVNLDGEIPTVIEGRQDSLLGLNEGEFGQLYLDGVSVEQRIALFRNNHKEVTELLYTCIDRFLSPTEVKDRCDKMGGYLPMGERFKRSILYKVYSNKEKTGPVYSPGLCHGGEDGGGNEGGGQPENECNEPVLVICADVCREINVCDRGGPNNPGIDDPPQISPSPSSSPSPIPKAAPSPIP